MNGKLAAVLGVGPGLGAAIVRRFAGEGFAVVLMVRNEDGLSEIQREINSVIFSSALENFPKGRPQGILRAF